MEVDLTILLRRLDQVREYLTKIWEGRNVKKVRMEIIGLGGMGQQHVRFVRELPEAELTASIRY